MQAQSYPSAESSIQFLSGPLAGKTFPVTKSSFTLGRAPDNDVVINDNSVSRNHARLIQNGSGWSIEKLAPQNTLTINQRNIQQETLNNQDVVGLGTGTTFRFVSTNLGQTVIPQPSFLQPTVVASNPYTPTPPPPAQAYPPPMPTPGYAPPMPVQPQKASGSEISTFGQALKFGMILGLIITVVYFIDFALHFSFKQSTTIATYFALLLLLYIVLYFVVPLIAGLQLGRRQVSISKGALVGLLTSLLGAAFTFIPIVIMTIIVLIAKPSSDVVALPFVDVGYTFITGIPGIMLGAVGGAVGVLIGSSSAGK